jgi:hypothetical protein
MQIPDVFIANFLNYTHKEMFKATEAEKASPEIKFDIPQ